MYVTLYVCGQTKHNGVLMWYIDLVECLKWWNMDGDYDGRVRLGYSRLSEVGSGTFRWHVESHSVWVF